MTLITQAQTEQLLANGRAQRAAIDRQDQALDFKPVVKLFTPDVNATWLLTELDGDSELAFGLCDLGLGSPELGYVSLTEAASAVNSSSPSNATFTSKPTRPSPPTLTKRERADTSSPRATSGAS